MIRLSRNDASSLSLFNNMLFHSDSGETRIRALEHDVSETKRELMRLMRDLELTRQQPAITPVSETALRDFFNAHPSMNIAYEDGKLTLKSVNQSVAFHTRRGRNAVGANNDIIYVTLPLYSFKLDFFPDGKVVGSAEKSNTLEKVWEGGPSLRYGHPHTQHRSGSRTFGSLCNGNNRFIQDWSYMRSNGIMDGCNVIRILSKAAIWMETVNISDMYGTELACGPRVPENITDGLDVDGLLHYRTPIADADANLLSILDDCGAWIYRMALWSLWMAKHFFSLPDCLNRCNCLYQAALYDSWIILKKQEVFNSMCSAAFAEMGRVGPVVARCYSELGGFYPDYGPSSRTVSQILPELFPENSNADNMEECHDSDQCAEGSDRNCGI